MIINKIKFQNCKKIINNVGLEISAYTLMLDSKNILKSL